MRAASASTVKGFTSTSMPWSSLPSWIKAAAAYAVVISTPSAGRNARARSLSALPSTPSGRPRSVNSRSMVGSRAKVARAEAASVASNTA
jgi:hypothetical protein